MSNFVISRTPFRLSLAGGGSDYPAWYRENPGAVLATSIDKYCYITCRWLPPFFEHKYSVAWSQLERVREIDEIRHPSVRETLKFLGITEGVDIHHTADLPARAGMGTSSAFTVGLLKALYSLLGEPTVRRSTMRLALDAIHIEQVLIKENVGSQDQVTSAFGGFNRIDFAGDEIKVTPIVKTPRVGELESHLMLFFTGFSRTASEIAKPQIERVKENREILKRFYEMVTEGIQILMGKGVLTDFGDLLDEAWKLKRQLSDNVSTDYIDYIYNTAITTGAIGGKLLGAGGGGFMLFFVGPELQPRLRERLSDLLYVPFKFEDKGSEIIFRD
jgi:D-glycero-alpha-D-manno-heptose-7-phosphate kinase